MPIPKRCTTTKAIHGGMGKLHTTRRHSGDSLELHKATHAANAFVPSLDSSVNHTPKRRRNSRLSKAVDVVNPVIAAVIFATINFPSAFETNC